ncbi:MAG TPA: hypothetical protein VFM18_07585 [Methanosarcina sp.]|nr:hypothetical protein [Methanosarcina sp.]
MVDHAKTSFASVVGKGLMTVEAAESHATERVHDFIVHMTNQLINILPSHRRGPAPETTAETPDTAQDPDQSQSGTSTGTSDAVSTAEQPAEATDQPAPAAEQSTQAVTEEPAVTAADVQTSDTPPDQRA